MSMKYLGLAVRGTIHFGEKYHALPATACLVYFPPVSYYACPARYKELPVLYQPPNLMLHM
jgi:hypothetical protein